ncbi:penicillin acylase family protein [Muricauda sp. 2012CJ35-5]|uniref:Penicillin acylase family protein n=1 Tax=Flagellimonas spongiicola TaxID=2942208 RepID=A0ABT0PSG1_9FLAO|nr:penicillin acylase family protein [Allomuricauda spongiicola]MCL6274201.1 penicillin acylase family protein [Allomuricauda spongiicola]
MYCFKQFKIKKLRKELIVLLVSFAVTTASLGQESKIQWDTWGVPHISANNLNQTYYAFGWAQMKAHANLILRMYGKSRGRSSEYWGGQEHLQSDKNVWSLEIPTRAQEWYNVQSNQTKGILEHFIRGMNDYAKKNPEAINPENRPVLPVVNTDPLGHLQLSYHVMVGAFALNQQAGAWRNAGSNAWALAPKKTSTGNTMLLIQPHPPWFDAFKFFEAHLKSGDLNLYGIAQVGSPTIAMGFNEQLGWGLTFNQADTFDLIELELDGDKYKSANGSWKALEVTSRSLKTKSEKGVSEVEVFTKKSEFGYIITEKGNKGLALRLSGLDRPFMMEQFFEMGTAKNSGDFLEALGKLQLPLQNIVYGDKEGTIGYVYNGIIPKREYGDHAEWSQILPASKEGALVEEYHTFEELPKLINPESGFVANSNNSPWTSTFPIALKEEDYPKYFAYPTFDLRSRRSLRMLLEKDKHSFEDLLESQGSTYAELADLVLDKLVEYAETQTDDMVKKAGETLSNWDRKLDADSQGAVLFINWYFGSRRNAIFETPFEYSNVLDAPSGLTQEAKAQLKMAAQKTIEQHGKLDVSVGEVYKIQSGNTMLNGALGLNEVGSFSAGFYRPGPNNQWVLLGGTTFSTVVEFAQKVKAKGLLSYGNFTQPSRYKAEDSMQLTIDRELRDVYFYKEEIDENTVETEQLKSP